MMLSKFTCCATIILVAGLVVDTSAYAQHPSRLLVQTFDAQSGRPIDAEIIINGEVVSGVYSLPEDADSKIQVEATARQDGYYPRTAAVDVAAIRAFQVTYKIYLAPRQPDALHTRAAVRAAKGYLTGTSPDRAIALLEAISEEISPRTRDSQFGTFLRFTQWRAYFVSCTEKFADHCSSAIDLGRKLLSEFAASSTYFENESIPISELRRCEPTVNDHLHRIAFHRAKWNLARNRTDEAMETLSNLMRSIDRDSGLLARLRIRRDDVDLLVRQAQRQLET